MGTKKVLQICGIVIAASILIEILFIREEPAFWWHALIGAFAIVGFLGCLALTVIAKGLGKHVVQRDDDYWDGGESE